MHFPPFEIWIWEFRAFANLKTTCYMQFDSSNKACPVTRKEKHRIGSFFGRASPAQPLQAVGVFDKTLRISLAAPIPEPETYALMLAGLGLLGVAARRRADRA